VIRCRRQIIRRERRELWAFTVPRGFQRAADSSRIAAALV
jgi:hypothetical protein